MSTIIRLPRVMGKVGSSRSSIYLMISKGLFPKPVKLGVRAVGWKESEIDEWIEDKVKQRDEKDLDGGAL